MIGPLAIGRKAAKYGYKRYGVPGAVLAGAGGVAGYVVVKRKFTGGSGGDTGDDATDADGPDGSSETGSTQGGSEPEQSTDDAE